MKKKITAFICLAAISALCLPAFGCSKDKLKFTLSEEGGKHYTVSCANDTALGECEIPAYFGEGENYAPVTEIADEGFLSCYFSKITIPATVTRIGVAAFSFCPALKAVEFAEGIKITEISRGLFGESTDLKEIKIPSTVTKIDALAFKNCVSLTSVTMENVVSIGLRAFDRCSALEEISLPSTLKTVGDLAFFGTGLKSVEIPASVCDTEEDGKTVRGLGDGVFCNCQSLVTAKIFGNISTIPSAAFGYCPSLREITIPLSVKEIKGALYGEDGTFQLGHAFYVCEKLTDVYYEGSEEQWKDIKIDTKGVYENKVSMNNKAIIDAAKHFNTKI